MAAVLSEYRPLQSIAAPGTLDGGDVLRLGRTLYVGLSTRTNEDGAGQLARHVAPLGYSVECVQTAACLHLKSAVTAVDSDRVLCNPEWIDTRVFSQRRGRDRASIPSEPHAANVLRLGQYDRVRRQPRAHGCRPQGARLQRLHGGCLGAGEGRGGSDVLQPDNRQLTAFSCSAISQKNRLRAES